MEEMVNEEPFILSSTVYSALLVSHGIRSNARLILYFADSNYIDFISNKIRNVRPDMQSTIGIFRKVILLKSRKRLMKPRKTIKILPGISYRSLEFSKLIINSDGIFFHEPEGQDIRTLKFSSKFKFIVFYPHANISDIKTLLEKGAKPIKVAPKYKLPGPIIMVVNNYVDRGGVKNHD
ncbi:MAG: hypothetical protein NZ926_02295 [Candidatus Methanomethylicia archaeon]|nr:hypothetical protein [Candidatus Methanomethylicia archaeon]MDW7988968.1 hypothetical protein [Nitrososphaerota archaeon]